MAWYHLLWEEHHSRGKKFVEKGRRIEMAVFIFLMNLLVAGFFLVGILEVLLLICSGIAWTMAKHWGSADDGT